MKRPVLRYHGGKYRISDWIISFFPEHSCYVEPFGGGASVLMNKPRVGTEIYNDLDGDVVNLFRVLRDRESAAELAHRLKFTAFSRQEFDESYDVPNDSVDQARKLIVRSFLGHGSDSATRRSQGGFRTKRSSGGDFTRSPAMEFAEYPDVVMEFHRRLCGVVIENKNAVELIQQFDSDRTLIYVDPPYVLSSRSLIKGSANSKNGYRHEMTDDDHRLLAETLHSCKGAVVLSGYPTDLYDKNLYSGWRRFSRKAVAEGGKSRVEVVWLNDSAIDRLAAGSSITDLFEVAA